MGKQGLEVIKNFLGRTLSRGVVIYLLLFLVLTRLISWYGVSAKVMDYLRGTPYQCLQTIERGQTPASPLLRDAVRYYKNFLSIFPDSAEAMATLGYCYYHLGQVNQAVRYYELSASQVKEHFGLLHNLGMLYAAQSRYADAVKVLERAVALPFASVRGFREGINPYSSMAGDADDKDSAKVRLAYEKSYLMIIRCYEQTGEDDRVLKTFTRAAPFFLGKQDAKQESLTIAARAALRSGQTPVALSLLLLAEKGIADNQQRNLEIKQCYDKLKKNSQDAQVCLKEVIPSQDALSIVLPGAAKLFYYPPLKRIKRQGKEHIVM